MRKLTFKLPDGREYTLEVKLDDNKWWWTEGNSGCDCNRADYIMHVYPDVGLEEDTPCGDTIKLIKVEPEWEIEE